MTLVVCPSCGRSYSGAANACGICGRPTDPHPSEPAGANTGPVVYRIEREPADGMASIDPATLSFFPVAVHKFLVMSIFTLGFYELYWCYKNWVRIEQRTSHGISPLLRAIFAPVSSFWLFAEIHRHMERSGIAAEWNPPMQGAGYLALSAAARLPNGWWTVSMLSFAAFVPAVSSIQKLHERESGGAAPNSNYTTANIVTIAVGALLLLLILAGSLLPDSQGH